MAGTLDYAAYRGVPQPFRLGKVGGAHCYLRSTAPGKIVWSDGTVQTVAANTTVTYHDGTNHIDNSSAVYLLVATKGVGMALWKESDYQSFLSLQSGTYAVLFRVTDRVEHFQQC